MARTVVRPPGLPPIGPLPFTSAGTLRDQAGTLIADEIPVAVWPAGGRDRGTGRTFDHEGEAAVQYASALRGTNRKLEVDGVKYAIVDAIVHPVLPHVALTLRAVKGAGS